MSFNIDAKGGLKDINKDESRSFSYNKTNCTDSDSWSADKLNLVANGMGSVIPNDGTARTMGYFGVAKIESLHMLVSQIDFLKSNCAATGGIISLQSVKTRTIQADTHRFEKFVFTGNNSGIDFMRQIFDALKDTDMNNYGPAIEMFKFFNFIDSKIRTTETPFINIKLSR